MIEPAAFHLTDEQWADVIRHYTLPQAARADLDILGANYLMFRNGDRQRLPNNKVEAGLTKISVASGKLRQLLIDLGPDAIHALTDPARCGENAGPTPRRDTYIRIAAQIEALGRFETWFKAVAENLPAQRRGFDPGNINWLVDQVARSFERHTGQPFAEQPGRRKAVAAYVAALDDEIRDGSIENAIDATCFANNGFKKQN